MLSRYATVCLLTLLLYAKQQYYCCTPDTTGNTTACRCVGAWCCVVQYVRIWCSILVFRCCLRWQYCGVRYSWYCWCWVYCSTLVRGVLNTARTGSMSRTSTEGPNTASTGRLMSSTEPRVQAVPQYKHPKWLEYSEYQECWTRRYFECSQHILPKYCQYSKYSSSPPDIREQWMLSAIKCGWNYRNGGAQKDGRNILHTPSILRILKVFWYYSVYSQYSQCQHSQYQPDEILPVFGSTCSTYAWNTTSMALSAVHNLETSTASTRGIWSILSQKYFSIVPGTGSICESIRSRIDGPSRGRSAKYYRGGQLTSLEYTSS